VRTANLSLFSTRQPLLKFKFERLSLIFADFCARKRLARAPPFNQDPVNGPHHRWALFF
jgi:hypothetical protein